MNTTRPARRASLLVAFSLLTSTATAYAECAWVLWTRTLTEAVGDPEWQSHGAYTDRGECADAAQQAAEDLASVLKKQPTYTDIQVARNGVMYNFRGRRLMFTQTCLPDTVDPRGPKGK